MNSSKIKSIQLRAYKITVFASVLAALAISANAQTLVHYYYSASGTTITNDQVGSANGTLYGSATLSGGTGGAALRTYGVAAGLSGGVLTNGLQYPSAATADLTNSFTIENWFQTVTGSSGRQMFCFSDGTTGTLLIGLPSDYDSGAGTWYGHAYANATGNPSSGFVDLWGTSFTDSTGNTWLDDGGLYQMVLTYDGSTLTMYIDGQVQESAAISGLNLSLMTNVCVAGGSPWTPSDANMDGYTYAFGFIKGALSQAQVTALYNLGQDATVSAISNAILPATSYTWNGGSSSGNNWSDGANWVGGTAPTTSGAEITFAGSTRTSPIMNQTYSVTGLNFSNNAAAFTLSSSGSTLTLDGNLINNSPNAQMLTLPIYVAAASTWNGGGQNLLANGALSGSGGVIWLGAGTLTLGTGTSSLGGQLGLMGGSMVIPGGSLTVGGNLTAGYQFTGAPANGSATIIISNASVTVGNAGGNTGNIQAGLGANGQTVSGTITVTNNATLTANADSFWHTGGNGSAILNIQNGGVFNQASTQERWFFLGDDNSYGVYEGYATINIDSGGTMNVNQNGKIRMCNQWDGGTNTININGNLAFYGGYQSGGATNGQLDMHLGWGPARDIVNLNAGGVLTVGAIISTYASTNNGYRIFNFSGGKLVAAYNGALNIGTDANAFVNIATTSPTIIDTAGYAFDIQSPLLHATGASVDGGLTKQGAGMLTLSASNTFNGPITVSAGTLMLTPAEQGSNTVSVASGAILGMVQGSAATVGNVTMANNTTNRILLTTGSNPASAVLKVSTLTLNGTTTLQLAGTIHTGSFTVLSCTSHTGAGSYNSTVVGPQGFVGTVGWDGTGTNLVVNVTSAGGLVWQGATPYWDINNDSGLAAGNWLVNGSTATDYQQPTPPGDAVTFNDSGASGVAIYDVVSPASVLITNTNTAYTFASLGGYISGMTSVTKTGPGSVTMGVANDYSGNTIISSGTYQLGISGAIPGGAGEGNFVLNGTLDPNGYDNTYNNLSGSGTVNNSAAGLARFYAYNTADSTFSGHFVGVATGNANAISLHTRGGNHTLTLSLTGTNHLQNMQMEAGTLKITSGKIITDAGDGYTTLGQGANLEVSGGELDINSASNATAFFPISDSGGFTDTLLIDGGTLSVSNNQGTSVGYNGGNGILTITSGLFVNIDQTDLGLIVGDTGAQGATVNLNGGTMQVNHISSRQGPAVFNFNGGTLKPTTNDANYFGNYSTTLTANVLAGGAKIDTAGFNITIAQPLTGAGGLTKSGAGTLTLSGANYYTGNTTISNGVLDLAQASPTLASSSTVTIAGGAALQLDSATVTNQVASLVTNGVAAANGVYSSANSSGFITGSGYLQVGTVGPSGPETLTNSYNAGTHTLSLSWPAGQGWRLQTRTNLDLGSWQYLTDGSISSTNIPVDATKPTVFYRLTYP